MTPRRGKPRQAPHIDPIVLDDLGTGDAATLVPNEHHEGERFEGPDTEGGSLAGASFSECELLDWNAHETTLQGARFLQTRITRMHARILSARRSVWRDVVVASSRLGAVEWYDSELSQVVVANSKIGWVNLRASELRDVVFRHSMIEELDLSGASMNRVAFEETSVDKLILTGSKNQNLDLRGIEFRVLEGLDGLRGTIISDEQATLLAPLLAEHLGIAVED